MSGTDLDVVYIGGFGRSGSTLLLRLLGALDGVCPIGEVVTLWTHYCQMNRMCGCGKPFRECDFWVAVMDEAFGGIDQLDAASVIALKRLTRVRYFPFLAFPSLRPSGYQRRLSEYAGIMDVLYHAIQKVSGCDIIIDSSKRPSHALILPEIPSIRAKMLHLVRDSRACAYSWQRRKRRVEITDSVAYMYQFSAPRTALEWDANQVLMPLASRRLAANAVYRYEDLVAEPRRVLAEMAEWLGLPDAEFPFISDRVVSLGSDHSLWGNPSRFERGAVTIRVDDVWRREMAPRQRQLVTALSLPLLWKHGYLDHDRAPIGPSVETELSR